MNTIGIDIAYRSTGIAALDYDTGVLVAHELITLPRDANDDNLGANLAHVADTVRRFIDIHAGTRWGMVWLEQPIAYRSGTSTIRIAQVHGAIRHELHNYGHEPPQMLTAGEVKAHATGKGNANKQQMIVAARERWFVDLSSDEADAAWIASLGQTIDHSRYDGGAA